LGKEISSQRRQVAEIFYHPAFAKGCGGQGYAEAENKRQGFRKRVPAQTGLRRDTLYGIQPCPQGRSGNPEHRLSFSAVFLYVL
jgi:hypothetical protein